MRKKTSIVFACAVLSVLLTACGGAVSNGLMAGASPETSAMVFAIYDGEVVTRMYLFDSQQEQDILDQLDAVKATEAGEWTLEDITLPLYGLEIGTTDGLGVSAAWSNGYWITQDGKAYRFDFDFAGLEQTHEWSDRDEFPGFSAFPCARALTQDENGWSSTLLDKAGNPNPPDGISMSLVDWSGDTVTVNITNESSAEWAYGEYYELQVLLDGEWYEIPPAPGNWGFNDIGLLLQAGETQEKVYRLGMYGDLPAGTYRLVAYELAVEGTVDGPGAATR